MIMGIGNHTCRKRKLKLIKFKIKIKIKTHLLNDQTDNNYKNNEMTILQTKWTNDWK